MNLWINAKILGTQGCGGDQEGNRIEQIVAVELPTGIRLGIYDGVIRVTPDMVGKEKDIAILVLVGVNGTRIIPATPPLIQPSSEKYLDFPYHYASHKYYGIVEKVGVKDIWHKEPGYRQLVDIDVGIGHILADIDKETFSTLKKGDFVELDKTLTEILDVR